MRQQLALFAAIAVLFSFAAFSAQAMPAASLKGVSNSGDVVQVSGGCGRFRHRDRWGHCRRD
jgi:hypothetical protein